MSYETEFIGLWSERTPPEPTVITRKDRHFSPPLFKRERLGIPSGTISHEKNKGDIKVLLDHFNTYGKDVVPPRINLELRQHLIYFKNCLEVYDDIVDEKVFSTDEIYYRCLSEGTKFTKFIKKSRALSLQAKEALDGYEDSEYVHEEYSGYDSIIDERYLIYWDDTEETVDWPYSLFELGFDPPEEELENILRHMFKKYGVYPYTVDDTINVFDSIANKMSSLNRKDGKTCMLKDTWGVSFEGGPWYATRKVVPTTPGKTRDTGVADIQTLLHLKMIHKHARKLSELLPYSANCSIDLLQKRVARVKSKANMYMHVDFKKFGLSTHRGIGNSVLRAIGKDELVIPSVYLNVDGTTYETKQGGGSLGWLDPLFAIGIIGILYNVKEKYGYKDMDFIVFNDDVEISMNVGSTEEGILRRDKINSELELYGLQLSYRKIFLSEMFVFLENYDFSCLNMEKNQLAVGSYAKSLSSPYHWQAKYHHSEGYQRVRMSSLTEKCQNSFPSDGTDKNRPYEVGGWTRRFDHTQNLNLALVDASPSEISFYLKMSRYKEPHLMPKRVEITVEILRKRKERRILESYVRRPRDGEVEFDPPRRMTVEEEQALTDYSHLLPIEEEDDEPPPPLPRRNGVEFRDTG